MTNQDSHKNGWKIKNQTFDGFKQKYVTDDVINKYV